MSDTVEIWVGGFDISDRVIFAETSFQAVASAQPGSCSITVKGTSTFTPGHDQIWCMVNGQRKWWGYLFNIEQGYIFPDDPEPKVILHGVDLNILFDKLVMYNHAHPTWYPDGGGVYKREKVTLDDGSIAGYIVTVPRGTWDKSYITTMMADFDLDKVSPTIKYGQTAAHDSKIHSFSKINTGDTDANWTPPGAGTTLRAFFQDVSANVLRTQPGSTIWYIDPEGYIVWDDVDRSFMDFSVGDGGEGIVFVRDLRITTDISSIKNDVLVFTGTLDPTPTSKQEHLLFVHKINNPSVNLFGRFQWSEVMGSDWMKGMINARATKVLNQEGVPAMRAEFTIFGHEMDMAGVSSDSLYPGRIARIFSTTHAFQVYDPVLGLQTLEGINIPIRAVDMRFPTQDVVEYHVTCSYDTQDPWGLLLALKRPPTRGLVQPNFNVIDRRKSPKTYIEATPMTLVKEYAVPIGGKHWQLTYAYIRGSLTVVVGGLRRTPTAEPTSGAVGFLEYDPDRGQFSTDARSSQSVYVEYHVWHNLVD